MHTPPIRVTHNSSQLVVGLGPPGSAWRLLASARAKVGGRPSIPVGVTLLLLAAQVQGSGSVELGKGTPNAAGKALFSALDLCPWTACPARPSAECTWGRMMTSNDFGLLEETFGLWPGKVGLYPRQQDLHRKWDNPGGQEGHTPGEVAPHPGPVYTSGVRGVWQCPPSQIVRYTPLDSEVLISEQRPQLPSVIVERVQL